MSTAIDQPGFEGSVPSGIAFFAATFHIPTVAEYVYDKKDKAAVPKGILSASSALSNVLAQTQLRWEMVDGVIHIYDPTIMESQHNFLNYRFAWFKVPKKPAEFKYLLENRLNSEHLLDPHRKGIIGGMYSGIMSDDLGSATCVAGEFREITARELLLKEAAPARLVSILTYPNTKEKFDEKAWKYVIFNWSWGSIDVPPKTIDITPPPG